MGLSLHQAGGVRACAPYLLSACLWALACPSYPYVRLEMLAWVWLVPMLLALRSVHGFSRFVLRVYLTLLIAFSLIMAWLAVASIVGWLFAALVSAFVFTIPFIVCYFVRRAFGWRVALCTMPLVWPAWEWLYHRTQLSFGAVELGQSQANLYWLIQYADTTGVWGIATWLVLFNVLTTLTVGRWLDERQRVAADGRAVRRLARRLALVYAVLLLPPLAYSSYVLRRADRAAGARKEITVLLVQTNVNPWLTTTDARAASSLGKAITLTNQAVARAQPDLIIWPETAVPYVLADERAIRQLLYRNVARWQTPLLTGVLDVQPATEARGRQQTTRAESPRFDIFNGSVLLAPQPADANGQVSVSASDIYHRRILMPFIERVPYNNYFPFSRLKALNVTGAPGLTPGQEATTFTFNARDGAQVTTGTMICYEQLYPAEAAALVRGGAQVLAFLTSQGWFSQTHGPYQLAALAKLRSIETHRAIARAADTGVTWLVDPYGRVYQQVPWWSEQTLLGRVEVRADQTLYVRYTDYWPKACAWLSLALCLATAGQLLRRRMQRAAVRTASGVQV